MRHSRITGRNEEREDYSSSNTRVAVHGVEENQTCANRHNGEEWSGKWCRRSSGLMCNINRTHDEPVKYSRTLKKPHIQPPEIIGRVRLSSRDPRSARSLVTSLTSLATRMVTHQALPRCPRSGHTRYQACQVQPNVQLVSPILERIPRLASRLRQPE